jgi:hypothetical protein
MQKPWKSMLPQPPATILSSFQPSRSFAMRAGGPMFTRDESTYQRQGLIPSMHTVQYSRRCTNGVCSSELPGDLAMLSMLRRRRIDDGEIGSSGMNFSLALQMDWFTCNFGGGMRPTKKEREMVSISLATCITLDDKGTLDVQKTRQGSKWR